MIVFLGGRSSTRSRRKAHREIRENGTPTRRSPTEYSRKSNWNAEFHRHSLICNPETISYLSIRIISGLSRHHCSMKTASCVKSDHEMNAARQWWLELLERLIGWSVEWSELLETWSNEPYAGENSNCLVRERIRSTPSFAPFFAISQFLSKSYWSLAITFTWQTTIMSLGCLPIAMSDCSSNDTSMSGALFVRWLWKLRWIVVLSPSITSRKKKKQ